MDMRIAGSIFGFVAGAAGYIIFRYWLKPIREYKKLKSNLRSDIDSYEGAISEGRWQPSGSKKKLKATRKKAWTLEDCFNDELPSWYRILLKNRGESPSEAAAQLMGLDKIREGRHAKKHLNKAKKALLMTKAPG